MRRRYVHVRTIMQEGENANLDAIQSSISARMYRKAWPAHASRRFIFICLYIIIERCGIVFLTVRGLSTTRVR